MGIGIAVHSCDVEDFSGSRFFLFPSLSCRASSFFSAILATHSPTSLIETKLLKSTRHAPLQRTLMPHCTHATPYTQHPHATRYTRHQHARPHSAKPIHSGDLPEKPSAPRRVSQQTRTRQHRTGRTATASRARTHASARHGTRARARTSSRAAARS